MPLAKAFPAEEVFYDGSQIRGHWALETFDLEGDSAVCFVGGCDVAPEHMADLEDKRAGSRICGARMLHIVVEHFDCDLRLVTTRQRLLAALAAAEWAARTGAKITRRGDDLYDAEAKLSISVGVRTRVSGKIHFGVNVTNEGTPVPTRALSDYGIEPMDFGRALVEHYERELDGIERAMTLVVGVD